MNLLWGEIAEDKARNAFRQSLHRLRAVLGEDILPQDRDFVSLKGNGLLQSDRDAFVHACEAARWEDAVAAYPGEFLEAFETGEPAFDRWADAERVRLRAQFEEALRAAAMDAATAGRTDDALRYAQRLAATAPYDEDAALFEANTLVAAGRPAQALASLRQFGDRIAEELDLPLPASVRALADRLEKRSAREPHTPPGGHPTERARTSFVGRQGELARMLTFVAELKSERGATILVEGEPGMGKSRLLDEFADRARSLGGVAILRGREAALGGVISYAGIAEALRPLTRASGVAGASRHLLAEAARLLPELRDAFELPEATPIEDETGRLRFFEGVAALVDAAAYEKPIVMLIDDAQHASPSTLDLIVYLSRRLQQSPVLLVAAYRTDRGGTQSIDRLRELLSADSGNALIVLDALSPDDAESLIRELTKDSVSAASADVGRLARASRGRPYLAIELSRRAAAGEAPNEHPIPLRDVLWVRFQACSPSQRRIFFAASLFERSADIALLAAAAHLPETTAFDAVDRLVTLGLLRTEGEAYSVAHDASASFIVDASGLAGRALLAGWAADALAATPAPSEAELAALYTMAGRRNETFAHARRAAFAAASVGASSEVTRLLSIALTFAPGEAERRDIDSLLAAFGRTRLTLPGAAAVDAPADAPAEPAVETDAAPRETRRWQTGTARQWIVSVAISAVVVIAGFAARNAIQSARAPVGVADTLYLEERGSDGRTALRLEAGVGLGARPTPVSSDRSTSGPAWTDSLRPPWSTPLPSPDGRLVALRRASPRGDELFVVSSDKRDTTAIAMDGGDNVALGWSPDSRALLVSRIATQGRGDFRSGLFVYWRDALSQPVVVDSAQSHVVTEASWSPSGQRVAWVARVGQTGQRDVFVARADGRELRNLSANPADDFGLGWSPDGSLLAFASTRTGSSRLYVYDFDNSRLWPVSDRPGESHPTFSPDGRTLAFESTRDGDLAVYVRRALGGGASRLTPQGRQFSILSWRGAAPTYVDRVRIIGPGYLNVGDSTALSVLSVPALGGRAASETVEWSLLDPGVIQLERADGDSAHVAIVAHAPGEARVVARVPGWRTDTLVVAVSDRAAMHIEDHFAGSVLNPRWLALGSPAPFLGRTQRGETAVFPNGDLEWESGLLGRTAVPLREGLRVRVKIDASSPVSTAARLTVGFAPSAPLAALDRVAPRLSPLIAVQWDGRSGAVTYTVGSEQFADAATSGSTARTLEIQVTGDRQVVFRMDERERWRTSLRFLGGASNGAYQLWIGGRATGSQVGITELALDVPASPPPGRP